MALICVVGALIVFNPIVSGVVGGLVATSSLQQRAVDEVREGAYMTVCQSYKGATTWERWTTPVYWKFGWCEDYLDRM
ncbi:hypothetical protein D3C87_2047220 [compost metagenome]